MSRIMTSGEVVEVTISFHYHPYEEHGKVGAPVRVVPNAPEFNGAEFDGVIVGYLPKSVDVFCSRDDASLAVGATQSELHVLVPDLHRLFSEHDCFIVYFNDTREDNKDTPQLENPSDTSWDAQPSTAFSMPAEVFSKHVGGSVSSLANRARLLFSNAGKGSE